MEAPTVDDVIRKNITKSLLTFAEEIIGKPQNMWSVATEKAINGMVEVFLDAFQLFVAKNQDYGTDNVSTNGEIGIMMRIRDKVNRLKNIFANSRGEYASRKPLNESVEDSFIDIGVLGLMGYCVCVNMWPDVDHSMRII